ncbi:MAG: ATP-binding cassette domain-containing protein [Proteobacteria bacterium]|nr:ATP-binding cassette domain-containing protein [Pseudomonadota bacterium]
MALLEMENLTVEFGNKDNAFRAVDNINLSVEEGEIIGVVGESGSGKSVSMLALMGLVGYPGRVKASKLNFGGTDLLTLSDKNRRKITGRDVAMVFQEPMTSLNPCFTVGFQIMETLKVHECGTREERKRRTIELLDQVGIPAAASRVNNFPHQLSGGMNQRVMIAMAIACNPRLLIADEPTTALDVTIQAQILDLLLELQRERNMALILITHDMAVVAETASRVAVMYAGQMVEQQTVRDLFSTPYHPYTSALLSALPERGVGKKRLPTINGVVPGMYDRPSGCLFNPRCEIVSEQCTQQQPEIQYNGEALVRCHTPLQGSAS